MRKGSLIMLAVGLTYCTLLYEDGFAQYNPLGESESIQMSIINIEPESVLKENPEYKSVKLARVIAIWSVAITGITGLSLIEAGNQGFYASDDRHEMYRKTGIALLLTSLLAAPSSGSLYANDYRRFVNGLLFRTIFGGGLYVIGNIIVLKGGISATYGAEETSYRDGEILVFLGLGLVAVHAIHDIFIGSRRAVHSYNESIAPHSSVSVTPWISTQQAGAGLTMNIRF